MLIRRLRYIVGRELLGAALATLPPGLIRRELSLAVVNTLQRIREEAERDE